MALRTPSRRDFTKSAVSYELIIGAHRRLFPSSLALPIIQPGHLRAPINGVGHSSSEVMDEEPTEVIHTQGTTSGRVNEGEHEKYTLNARTANRAAQGREGKGGKVGESIPLALPVLVRKLGRHVGRASEGVVVWP